jgi:hypothetical protein
MPRTVAAAVARARARIKAAAAAAGPSAAAGAGAAELTEAIAAAATAQLAALYGGGGGGGGGGDAGSVPAAVARAFGSALASGPSALAAVLSGQTAASLSRCSRSSSVCGLDGGGRGSGGGGGGTAAAAGAAAVERADWLLGHAMALSPARLHVGLKELARGVLFHPRSSERIWGQVHAARQRQRSRLSVVQLSSGVA